MTPGGVTCARLRLAHVTPPGVTSQNPHTLYTISSLNPFALCGVMQKLAQ